MTDGRPRHERSHTIAIAEIERLRAAATNLMAAIDNMHERGETFTARVSIAVSDMRRALEQEARASNQQNDN